MRQCRHQRRVHTTYTPQQNGISERDGQTLAQITRCLMKDGNFPPSLWGELIFTVAYLSNRSPHSALGGATPYLRLHDKDAQQGGRPLVTASHRSQRIRPPRDLYEEAGRPGVRRKLCEFSLDSRAYRIYNPVKGPVVESRNVTFSETPLYNLPLGVTSETYNYEGDVLRFTSVLDGPSMAEDTFDGEDFCSEG